MLRTIQFESRMLEESACWTYEEDSAVSEFYDQPCRLRISWSNPGRNVSTLCTPDFFVARLDNAGDRPALALGFEDWHPSGELEKLRSKYPQRYHRTPDGKWSDVVVASEAARHGLGHTLRTERDVSAELVRNFRFLYDYRESPSVASDVEQAVVAFVRRSPGVSIEALLATIPGVGIDDIYGLLGHGVLWADLQAVLLIDRANARLYESREVAAFIRRAPSAAVDRGEVAVQDGAWISWKGERCRMLHVNPTDLDLVSESGVAVRLLRSELERLVGAGEITGCGSEPPSRAELLIKLSPKSRARFERNVTAVAPFLNLASVPPDRSTRSLLRRYRNAETLLGDGIFGLVPRFSRCGRRGRRVDEGVLRLANAVIEDQLLTPDQRSMRSGYRSFLVRCQAEHLRAFSWRTFQEEVKKVPRERLLQRRSGHRAAIAGSPRIEGTLDLPKDGDRAFERVHLDHTEVDLELVDSDSRRPVGRPWLSIAIDAYSSRVLGHVLLFDPPSAISTLLLIRDIVRRHRRLPQTIITDHGAEFGST